MFGVLLACLMLVTLPIIAVQLPRLLSSSPRLDLFPESEPESETDDTGFDGAGEQTPTEQGEIPRASGTASTKTRRKPWDPPFPMSPKSKREPYLVLGPSPRRTREGTESEDKDDFEHSTALANQHLPFTEPTSALHETDIVEVDAPHAKSPRVSATQESSPQRAPTSISRPQEHAPVVPIAAPRKHGSNLTLVQTCILLLALLMLICILAIFTAHCLAWFVVYKTESRLGEVRNGVLRGGDMRVCLCARG